MATARGGFLPADAALCFDGCRRVLLPRQNIEGVSSIPVGPLEGSNPRLARHCLMFLRLFRPKVKGPW